MKKILLFLLIICSMTYGANVYFDLPTNNQVYQIDQNGNAGVSYHILTVSFYYVTDWYGARVRYPDGNWSSWQTGQSGGWVFTEPGDYVIEGCVHVVQDFGGYSNYYMYSSSYVPFVVLPQPVPLTNVSVTGNITLYRDMTGFWGATLTDGIPPFTYNLKYSLFSKQ